jgi:hypothetical protein
MTYTFVCGAVIAMKKQLEPEEYCMSRNSVTLTPSKIAMMQSSRTTRKAILTHMGRRIIANAKA